MAPRGGGGRGGGGGSSGGSSGGSGSSRGSSSKSYQNPWSKKMKLDGQHFQSAVDVAPLVILCLLFLALIGIFVWSSRIKSYGTATQRLTITGGLRLALLITALAYGFRITDLFLHEFAVTVTNYYAIFYIFAFFFALCAAIATVFVIYSVISHHFQQSRGKPQGGSLRWLHMLVLLVLCGLLVANMYYFIRFQIATVNQSRKLASTRKGYGNADSAFCIVILFAAIEILALAILTLLKGRKAAIPSKVGIFLVLLVALPFLLRALVDVALAIKYLLPSNAPPAPRGIKLVRVLLVDLPTVVAFAGIVLVSKL